MFDELGSYSLELTLEDTNGNKNIILKKETNSGTIGTVVPNHKELKIGTLKGILELAQVSEDDFAKYI